MTIVAVTVDETGVITDCVIDAVQAKANFDSQGQLLTDLTVPVPSKNELGADYGMGSISGIGKEWNEQAQALADYVVGKTADEVLGIAVDEATKPAEADLASSVTISIGGFQNAIAEAVDRAQPLGAQAGDELRLVTSNSMAAGNAPEGAAGMVETNVNIAAVTMNGDAITSCVIDAVQAQVSFDGQGQLLTDLSAPVPSKNDRGADYGMGAVSSIGKEWNEQAAAFAAYVTGKTLDEVAGIAVDEATKPAEAAAVPAAPLPPSDRLRRSGGGGDEAQAISGDLSGRVRYSDHGHGLCGEPGGLYRDGGDGSRSAAGIPPALRHLQRL